MDAIQYCAEHHHETKSGKISFTKKVVDNFIEIYTHMKPSDFTDEMRTRLKIMVMIDMATKGFEGYYPKEELPPSKIELPDFIFS